MRLPYAVLALLLGLTGFITIEVSSSFLGLFTALTSLLVLDAAVYMLSSLLLAFLFKPLFRRSKALGVVPLLLLYLILFAPLAGILGGLVELTITAGWGSASLLRGALITTPINLIYSFVLELWFIALPLGIISGLIVWRAARQRVRR